MRSPGNLTSLARAVVKFHAGGWSECLEISILDPIREGFCFYVCHNSKFSVYLGLGWTMVRADGVV